MEKSLSIEPQELVEEEIPDYLDVIQTCVDSYCNQMNLNQLQQTIQKKIEIIKSLNLEIIPIGRTNAGKSTLINSIMGHNILNTSSIRETTAIWRITQSSQKDKLYIQQRSNEYNFKQIIDCSWEQSTNFPQNAKQEIKKFSTQLQEQTQFNSEEELVVSYPGLAETIDPDTAFQMLDVPGIDDVQQCDFIENYCKKRIGIIQPVLVIPLTSGTIEHDKEFKSIQTALIEYQGKYVVVFTRMNHFISDVENEIDNGDCGGDQQDLISTLQARINKLKQSVERLFGQNKCQFFIYELSKRGCEIYTNQDLQIGESELINQEGVYKVNESIPSVKNTLKQLLKERHNRLISQLLQEIMGSTLDSFYQKQQHIMESTSFKQLQAETLSNQSQSFQDNYIGLMQEIYSQLTKIEEMHNKVMEESINQINEYKKWNDMAFETALKNLENYLKDETQGFIKTDTINHKRIIKQNYQEDYKKFILDETKSFFQRYFEQDKAAQMMELKQNLSKIIEQNIKQLYQDNPLLLKYAKIQQESDNETPQIQNGLEIDYAVHESLVPTGRTIAATTGLIIAGIATKLILPVGVIFTVYQLQWTRKGQSDDILKEFIKMINSQWKSEKEQEFQEEINKLQTQITESRRLIFNKHKDKLEQAIMIEIQSSQDQKLAEESSNKLNLLVLKETIMKQAFDKNGLDYDKIKESLQILKGNLVGFISQIQQ